MQNDRSTKLPRRNFLAASSASIASSILLSRSLSSPEVLANTSTTNSLVQAEMTDALSVGYLAPNAPAVGASEADRESLLERLRRRTREALGNSIPEHPIRGEVFPPDAFLKDARSLDAGEPELLNGVGLFLAGLYTNNRQWSNRDSGSFVLRVKFDETSKCQDCTKVSSAAIGSTFLARPNNIAADFSAGIAINQVQIARTGALKLGLDLIDIGDPRDKSVVEKAIQVANTLAPLDTTGVAQLVAGTAGAFIEPASKILESFGIDYLKQDQRNKVLWSSKTSAGADRDITFVTGNQQMQPKLRRGIYFIAGLTRASQPPAWGNYFLRAADPQNQGPKIYLYRRDSVSNKVVPADFTYLTLTVDPAPIPPRQQA
jgi:hypothetical protein